MIYASQWPLSILTLLALFLVATPAAAGEGGCVQHTLQAECEVDGTVSPCDFNNLEPGTRYRVIVEADNDAELYIFTGVEDETATVEHKTIKKGKNVIPAEGWREVPEKNPGRVDVILHNARLPWADDILGTMKWSEVEKKLLPVVVKHLEVHGQCRKNLDEPPPAKMEEKMEEEMDREDKSDRDSRKKKSRGKRKDGNKKKSPGVHVEPELLD